MADQRANSSPSRGEQYSLSDSTDFHQRHTQRTAEVHAHFFLPYLRPGMNLVDCGCGTGSITVGLAEAVSPGEVIGFEISASDVDLARERAKEGGTGTYGLKSPTSTSSHFQTSRLTPRSSTRIWYTSIIQ